MPALIAVLNITWKDLLAEWRTRETISAMFTFALIVILVSSFAFELRVSDIEMVAPGVLWIAFTFAGVLGINRAFVREADKNCLDGLLLAPVDRAVLYWGKLGANFVTMSAMELIMLPVALVLFNLPLYPPLFFIVLIMGTFGFVAVGTLFAAMTVHTRTREVMLPVLLFPVAVPLLIAAVKATAALLEGSDMIGSWLRLLAAFDLIFATLATLMFKYVMEE